MIRTAAALLAALALAACEQMPQSKDPPPPKLGSAAPAAQPARGSSAPSSANLAGYRAAIVKDLIIEESALIYVRPEDRAELESRKAELIADFSARFRDELAKKRYFEIASSPAGAGTALIQPKAVVLDPGAKTGVPTGTPTRIDVMVVVTDAVTGAQVGAYVTPTQFLPRTSLPVASRLQVYFPAAAAKVAAGMASIR